MRIRRPLRLAVVAGLGVLAFAAPAPAGAQQQQSPCAGEQHRQFDFWVGDWDVTNLANGQTAGHNVITSILGGCVLHESYDTSGGYAGQSYNAYDRQSGKWHQTWVDNTGLVLKIEGGLEDGKMVLSGPGVNARGQDILNQITWTPHEDGTVRQTWLISADGGETWSTAFDGLYRKRK